MAALDPVERYRRELVGLREKIQQYYADRAVAERRTKVGLAESNSKY
jgi:hypothetical protein